MKQYNRSTKKWQDEEDVHKKKRKECHHDYVLITPDDFTLTDLTNANETIVEVYRVLDEYHQKLKTLNTEKLSKLTALGAVPKYHPYIPILFREYACTKCGVKRREVIE